MNDYTRNSFYTRKNEVTDEVIFYIKLNGILIEVPRDVYRVCFNSYMKTSRLKKDIVNQNVSSFDAINSSGNTLYDTIKSDDDVIDNVNLNALQDVILRELCKMKKIDCEILYMYIFQQMSGQEIAQELGLAKSTVTYKVKAGLTFLRNFLKKLVD